MNILFISDVYFPRINGVSTSIKTFREKFIAAGHRVILVAPDYGNNGVDDEDIIRIPARTIPFDREDRFMKRKLVKELAFRLAKEDIDLIHIQTPFVAHYAGTYLSEFLQVPRIETYHTFFEEYFYNYIPLVPHSWLKLVARRFTRKQCNDLDHIIVPSTAMLKVLRTYEVNTKASVIPTGIEPDEFMHGDGKHFRTRHGIEHERPVLVHVGRIAHEKNIDFLLRMLTHVWHEMPDILLLIAGEGPAVSKLQKAANNLGLKENVKFLGYQDRKKSLNDCYRAGDLFVFSSRTETQGLVLLEAMMLGVPVVSTAIMGTRDIVLPEIGARVAEEIENQFAHQVIKLLNDNELRKKMSQEAHEYAKLWSADRYANEMLECYLDVCAQYKIGDSEQVLSSM